MTVVHLRVMTIVGGLLVVLALVLGQQHFTYDGKYCGSAFNPAPAGSSAIYTSAATAGCRDLTDDRQGVAIGVGLLGAALLGGGLYGIRRQENATA